MKKLFMTAMLVAASMGLMNAQTSQKQVVEEGGTGPFKSEVIDIFPGNLDSSLCFIQPGILHDVLCI